MKIKIIAAFLLSLISYNIAHALSMTCNKSTSSYDCLLCNCYHESRGESLDGMVAVSKVVLSRTKSPDFPKTICGNVYKPSQFSWTIKTSDNNIRTSNPDEIEAYGICKKSVDIAMSEGPNGIVNYYNPYEVTPKWSQGKKRCALIGNHVFVVPKKESCPKHVGISHSKGTSQHKSHRSGGTQ